MRVGGRQACTAFVHKEVPAAMVTVVDRIDTCSQPVAAVTGLHCMVGEGCASL